MSNQNVKSIVSKMNLREQLLEMLMLDIRFFDKDSCLPPTPVRVLPKELSIFLKEYPVGGIVLFRENLQNLEEIVQLTNDLQQNSVNGRFICVDQEGGVITRIPEVCDMPGNMALGSLNELPLTEKAAELIAFELRNLGINFNFAPVVDINTNPDNPVIGVRSFGSDPCLVANHGVAYCKGLHSSNIISCCKHFPGHGNTLVDSHISLPTVNRTKKDLYNYELLPFANMIKAGVDAVMTAHIVVPSLDEHGVFSSNEMAIIPVPATFSEEIITGILRKKLGFRGLVVSDALDMNAITNSFTPVEATINSLKAGVNVITMPLYIRTYDEMDIFADYFEELLNIIDHYSCFRTAVFNSCCRIIELKFKKVKPFLNNKFSLDEAKKNIRKYVGTSDSRKIEKDLAFKCVTLLKNEKSLLPWNVDKESSLILISENSLINNDAFAELNSLGFVNVTKLNYSAGENINFELMNEHKVLLITRNLNEKTASQVQLIIDELNLKNISYVLISGNNPYDILYLKNIHTNVLAFGCSGFDQTNKLTRLFSLNIKETIRKIMTADRVTDFNVNKAHIPITKWVKEK